MTEIIPKHTKSDFIAGVIEKPTERSERLWRSTKSALHPETVARRDPGVIASDMMVISTFGRLGDNHQPSRDAHSGRKTQMRMQ